MPPQTLGVKRRLILDAPGDSESSSAATLGVTPAPRGLTVHFEKARCNRVELCVTSTAFCYFRLGGQHDLDRYVLL